MRPGTNCADAPVSRNGERSWLLSHVGGSFVALSFGDPGITDFDVDGIACAVLAVGRDIEDCDGRLAERYDGKLGTTYLIRPDQHVAARWRRFDRELIGSALDRATCRVQGERR